MQLSRVLHLFACTYTLLLSPMVTVVTGDGWTEVGGKNCAGGRLVTITYTGTNATSELALCSYACSNLFSDDCTRLSHEPDAETCELKSEECVYADVASMNSYERVIDGSPNTFLVGTELKPEKTCAEPGPVYIGCYEDTGPRHLPTLGLIDSQMTQDWCLTLCTNLGKRYFGVEYGVDCWCGDTYGTYPETTGCNMPCGGNANQLCGAHSKIMIFDIESVVEAVFSVAGLNGIVITSQQCGQLCYVTTSCVAAVVDGGDCSLLKQCDIIDNQNSGVQTLLVGYTSTIQGLRDISSCAIVSANTMIEIRRPWNASDSAVSDFLVAVSGVNITCDNTQFPSADENLSKLYLLIKEDASSATSQNVYKKCKFTAEQEVDDLGKKQCSFLCSCSSTENCDVIYLRASGKSQPSIYEGQVLREAAQHPPAQQQGALNTTKGLEQENIKLREDLINGTEVLEQRLKAVEEELRMEVLKVEKIKLKDLTNEIQKQNTPFVSFRAFPDESRSYIGGGKTLLFDSVKVNIGQHYIAENSTFICPYNAYYLFTVTVINGDSKKMRAFLRLEESKLHRVRSEDDHTDDQATIVVVTLCLAGQRVWVETQVSNSRDVYDMYGYFKSSSFSGSVLRTV